MGNLVEKIRHGWGYDSAGRATRSGNGGVKPAKKSSAMIH